MSDTVKLIIEISEDVYTRLFDNGLQDNEIAVDDVCEMARALRIGTPLPKGHGRLIDADALPLIAIDDANHGSNFIKIAPTIIEADKSESEE